MQMIKIIDKGVGTKGVLALFDSIEKKVFVW